MTDLASTEPRKKTHVRMTPALTRECRRLRIEQDLPVWKIAKIVGIGEHNAQKAIKGFPKRAKRGGRGGVWNDEQENVLRRLFLVADWDVLLTALAPHTKNAISEHARRLKIGKRRQPASRKLARYVHPVILQLRELREKHNFTRPKMGQLAGLNKTQITNWELGKTQLRFQSVVDWAQALGYELVLQPRGFGDAIAFPERKALMGAR